MRAKIGAVVVLVLVVFTATVGRAEPAVAVQIARGVWFLENNLKTTGTSNTVIIEMKDYLIVVDAGFPVGARLTMETAAKLSLKPVKYVFDTHHHEDHAYGNSVWTQAGAITLAARGVADEMRRYEPGRWQSIAVERKDVAELNRSGPEPPRQTFDRSPFVLKDGTREVRFYYFGWAHTRGDGFVYLPKERIVCTGDVALNGPYNYFGDGNLENWPKVIRHVERLAVTDVLPGHGTHGGREILIGQRLFLTELYGAVQNALRQGKKLDDLVKESGSKAVATNIELSPKVRNWVGDDLPEQVRSMYREVSAGKPIGDLPH